MCFGKDNVFTGIRRRPKRRTAKAEVPASEPAGHSRPLWALSRPIVLLLRLEAGFLCVGSGGANRCATGRGQRPFRNAQLRMNRWVRQILSSHRKDSQFFAFSVPYRERVADVAPASLRLFAR